MGDEIRVTVIAAGFDEVTPRPNSRSSSFVASNSGSIPVVPVTPVPVQEETVDVAPPTLATVPAWFGTRDIEPEVAIEEVVVEETRPVDSENRRRSSGFDDDMDFPEFLK
jgi:hypothetical protein